MGSIFLGGLLVVVNIAIAWWNCYVVGKSWDVVKHHGSAFERILMWCGAVQSTVGFSIPILIGLAFTSVSFLTAGGMPYMTQEEAQIFMEGIFSLWYLLVIFPILGSGLLIWIHSVREAIKRRDAASIATAAWNTYANVSNFANATGGTGYALGGVGKAFSGGSNRNGKGAGILILIMIAIVALLAGALITAMLIQRYRRQTVQQFAHA